jgi:hypothetical protein
MRIIEIAPLSNGGHRNQESNSLAMLDGWAVIPDGMETPNFPFGTVTTAEVDGIMTVTSWVAGTIPAPEPEPTPAPTATEKLRADVDYIAVMTNVDLGEV